MKNTNLKQAKFTSPQSGTSVFGKYVVENLNDMNLFFEAFPSNRPLMQSSIANSLSEGLIVIFGEPNRLGYNSYCFETILKDIDPRVHPSSHIRVKGTTFDPALMSVEDAFKDLKETMQKYDLYYEDDEVGDALASLWESIENSLK